MRNTLVKKTFRATRLMLLAAAAPALAVLPGCTDLTEVPASSITPENFYRNEAEILGGLASAYAQLRATTWSYYNLSQVSSDEHIVPTRGNDWYDNGRWLEIDRQGYGPTTAAGLEDVGGAWNDLFTGIARVNVVLNALADVNVANKPQLQAELRTLRAFYYYMLMDLFGGVPIVETTEVAAKAQVSRDSLFRWIEAELNAARTDLPTSWAATSHGRLTVGAADAILANMYVNAQVFRGTVSATGLTLGPAMWAEAVTAANRVINSPQYSLATNWNLNFAHNNHTSPENILVVKFSTQPDLGLNFVMRALHYNQFNPSPWNGFSTIADVYNAFDANDPRRSIFLVGQQTNVDPASPNFGQNVTDRQNNPLIFTTSIANVTAATEAEGARIMKWRPDPSHVAQDNGNDFAYFRLAEMFLIRAEALNEQGQTVAGLADVNTVRNRAFEPDQPLVALNQAQLRTAIFNERLFELTAEAKRRQDQIRAGTYTSALYLNNTTARGPYRVLMPIPQTQIDVSKGLLVQNPGY
jgi:hypothetical protein